MIGDILQSKGYPDIRGKPWHARSPLVCSHAIVFLFVLSFFILFDAVAVVFGEGEPPGEPGSPLPYEQQTSSTPSESPPILGEKKNADPFIYGLVRTYVLSEDVRSMRSSLPKIGEGSGGVDVEEPRFAESSRLTGRQ